MTPTLQSRIYTLSHRSALTRAIAGGARPVDHPELALRAEQLTSRRQRTALAGSLRRIVREAHAPLISRSRVIMTRRGPVIDAEDVIGAVAQRLSDATPISAEGVAKLELILGNADRSPLYNPSEPGTLRRLMSVALTAMEPNSSRFHEFSIPS